MPVKSFRPLTPSTRYITIADFSDITKTKPEKALVYTRKKSGGRNAYGRVTARGIGGGHKQKVRIVDFKRNKHGVEAAVIAIEYDPMRSARLALLEYKDGEKAYIIAPVGVAVGTKISSGPTAPPEVGNALPLKSIPVGIHIHNLELTPGRGGRTRHRGHRGITRGMARNPVDHPNGGGQGKSKGGGGWQQLVSPWGFVAKGGKTRAKYKYSNRFIVVQRNGLPMKNK